MTRRTLQVAILATATALLLAACAVPNAAPKVTITSPSPDTEVRNGTPVVLGASASDAEDGDVSASITWSSSIDGSLTPDSSNEVTLSHGSHVLTATATDSGAQTGFTTVTVVVHLATEVVSEGTTLHLVGRDGDALVETGSAALPSAGLLPEHQVFDVVAHPGQPWLYASSLNSCSDGTTACWGNARIDRFVVDGDSLRYDGAAFIFDASQTAVACAQAVSGYVDQVGDCAPVGLVFSSDGSRLYVQDDANDVVQIFSVDASGDLTVMWEGADTYLHGMALDPTNTYLYNGSNVFDISADTALEVNSGNGGDGTAVVALAAGLRLVSTSGTDTVALYDLADPAAPALIDSLSLGGNKARDVDFTPDLERILTLGVNAVQALSFDGSTLTLDNSYNPPEAGPTQYRSVQLTDDGTRAVASWFTVDAGVRSGGADLFSVAPDGTLARLDRVLYGEEARTVLSLP